MLPIVPAPRHAKATWHASKNWREQCHCALHASSIAVRSVASAERRHLLLKGIIRDCPRSSLFPRVMVAARRLPAMVPPPP